MSKQIEIEYRSRFSKEEYERLRKFLFENAEDLGEDNKRVIFFTYPNKLLKVTENVSHNTAKITGKLNKIGEGSSFEEIEFYIDPADVQKAVKLFTEFECGDMHEGSQTRHNFSYKSVEIALKYSDAWGYHAELEVLISDERDRQIAEDKIKTIASELGLTLMSDDELKRFIAEKEAEIKASSQ